MQFVHVRATSIITDKPRMTYTGQGYKQAVVTYARKGASFLPRPKMFRYHLNFVKAAICN